MAADHAASGGLVRDELYLLFLSAVFSWGAGGFILPDALEKTVVGAAVNIFASGLTITLNRIVFDTTGWPPEK